MEVLGEIKFLSPVINWFEEISPNPKSYLSETLSWLQDGVVSLSVSLPSSSMEKMVTFSYFFLFEPLMGYEPCFMARFARLGLPTPPALQAGS